MTKIREYIKPLRLEDAYAELLKDDKSIIIGGGTFIKLQNRDISTAIDLSNLNLRYIKEVDGYIEIGAMTTLRDIETSELIGEYYGDFFKNTLKGIVGIQLRNLATVGGSIYSKCGFSDLIAALLVLDCRTVLHKGGERNLTKFLEERRSNNDILTKIIIKKEKLNLAFKSLKNSHGDYPVLNVAVSKSSFGYRLSVGARPSVARLCNNAVKFLNSNYVLSEENLDKLSSIIADEVSFGDNNLASKEYRIQICGALLEEALLEVENEDFN